MPRWTSGRTNPARDEAWAQEILDRYFGGRLQAGRGGLIDVLALPGLVVDTDAERVGLLTYRPDGVGCELAFMIALHPRQGIGSALLDALIPRVSGGSRIWLVTTNDNLDALRFYQRRGFRLRAVRPGAVDEARRSLKPEVSVRGRYGIPLRDEIELELLLPR